MRATDQMLTRLAAEIEEQQTFQDKLIEDAQTEGRDLGPNELELFERSRSKMSDLHKQISPVKEARQISSDSQGMLAELHRMIGSEKPNRPQQVEYRSAGAYVLDYWKASLGADDASSRLQMYNRAAAHQTTADNPGLLPQPILGPVVNFIDAVRPMVSALGPRDLPAGSWSRPRVTQHTLIAAQSAEKGELSSRKMIITKTPVTPVTYGGYVNVSRQDIDWTQPNAMDIVIGDLASQYAIITEQVFGTALVAGSTAGPVIPTGPATAVALTTALWTAAGSAFTATAGQGRLVLFISPDMLGTWGQLFAPVNPQNAQSPGFEAADFGSGLMGQIGGIPVIMSAGLAAGTMLLVSTSAVEVYEDRLGSLQVVEPSVLGVQVAYAGYFTWLILEATGVIRITKTP